VLPPKANRKRSLLLLAGAAVVLGLWGLGSGDEDGPSLNSRLGQSAKLGVVVDENVTVPEGWTQMDSFTRDYFEYFNKAERWANPITEEELERRLDSISGANNAVSEAAVTPKELAEGLVDAMNIAHLIDDLEHRTLKTRVLSESKRGAITQNELLFEDPFIGRFRALLLLPTGQGPHPGIVAHPGHSERAENHRDLRYGQALAERGFAVLILDPRSNDGGLEETRVSRQALLRGHSLIGLRVYEILLGRKYLRWDERVAPNKIGLQGHSGGSVTGNLVVRIDDGFAAYVSDLFSTYGIVLDRDAGFLGDETSSSIYYWHASIEDLSTSRVPMIQEPYGFEDGPERMFAFFEQHLR